MSAVLKEALSSMEERTQMRFTNPIKMYAKDPIN